MLWKWTKRISFGMVGTLTAVSIGGAQASKYNIPPSIRFTLDRAESTSPLVYYFSKPDTIAPYPILVLCEGSSAKGALRSIFCRREEFSERVQSLHVGYLTVEQWGIDGNEIDEREFWNHYTRSQRLNDHLKVIKHLEENPPEGWNGQFIFFGGSEGGLLVTDLSVACPNNTLATINWVGASDWPWADELWQFFEHWKQNSFWVRLYNAVPRWLPFSPDIPKTRNEYDALVQHIINNPTPDKWMAGMTYLYHADAFQRPPVDYGKIQSPFLVVKGTKDSDIVSCDQFVQKAQKSGAPITYFRIDGMDHWITKRSDVIDRSFEWLAKQLAD